MTDQHPITPPPELIAKWMTEARFQDYCSITEQVAYRTAQWVNDTTREPQPEPEGPTDEELQTLLYCEFTTCTGHGQSSDPIGFARAVLARWGK